MRYGVLIVYGPDSQQRVAPPSHKLVDTEAAARLMVQNSFARSSTVIEAQLYKLEPVSKFTRPAALAEERLIVPEAPQV